MSQSLEIKLWGARGSLPSPLTPKDVSERLVRTLDMFRESGSQDTQQFVESLAPAIGSGFGGNTPCLAGRSNAAQFIIDGGSGIRMLGYELMQGPCAHGRGEVHLFFTHFHWDHLIGLPFFTPLFIPGNQIHIYAVQSDLPEVFRTLFRKPYFPVPLERLGAQIHYHRLEPRRPFLLGDISLTPYQLDHPDPCWGYKIEWGKRVISYCVDTECTRLTPAELGPDLPLYQGVDLMLFDAQYTLMESIEKVNWGHAAASLGMDLAMREKIKEIWFLHHDPASNDQKIAAAEKEAGRYLEAQLREARRRGEVGHRPKWGFAVEGMVWKFDPLP